MSRNLLILKCKVDKALGYMKRQTYLSQKKDTLLSYAYPCDNYMDSILSNGLVRKTLQLFADKYCKEQIEIIKSTGQLVGNSNYPHFYDILQSCYKSLNIEEDPEVYVTNQLKGINALSVGTDSAPIILISRKAMISLSDGELKFMIGHELGHILQKNLMCHTIKGLLDNLNSKSEILGPIVSNLIDVPLNQWYRCAEYTADRAGYLCCRDREQIYTLFSKLFERESIVGHQSYIELFQQHPFIQSRLDNINEFAKTN